MNGAVNDVRVFLSKCQRGIKGSNLYLNPHLFFRKLGFPFDGSIFTKKISSKSRHIQKGKLEFDANFGYFGRHTLAFWIALNEASKIMTEVYSCLSKVSIYVSFWAF